MTEHGLRAWTYTIAPSNWAPSLLTESPHSENTEEILETLQQCRFTVEGCSGILFFLPVHLSTLSSVFFSQWQRCHRGIGLFCRQNESWMAEMRLILIREGIITLLLLLSPMLTTASPPISLSFSMTISLCLLPRACLTVSWTVSRSAFQCSSVTAVCLLSACPSLSVN